MENKTDSQVQSDVVIKNAWFNIKQNQDQRNLPLVRNALHHSVARMALMNEHDPLKPGENLVDKWQDNFASGQWLNEIRVVIPNATGTEWLAKKLLLTLPNDESLLALVTVDDQKPAHGLSAHLFVLHDQAWQNADTIQTLKTKLLKR